MVCCEAKISLYCFLGTFLSFTAIFTHNITYKFLEGIHGGLILGPLLHYVGVNAIARCVYRSSNYQVAIRSIFLGYIFAAGLFLRVYGLSNSHIFGTYMCIMAMFHFTEFLSIALIQPKIVSTDSFVLNHSVQYAVAAITSWLEYLLELYLLPGMKTFEWTSNVGLLMCVGGETLRKLAMFTARSNFNHLVQCEKADNHVLVTHGVYRLFRHPSYVGWFYWSIGTQIILLNPVCFVAYAFASWHFFRERINIEEMTLLNFFGQQYCDYQQEVDTGLPFIQDYYPVKLMLCKHIHAVLDLTLYYKDVVLTMQNEVQGFMT